MTGLCPDTFALSNKNQILHCLVRIKPACCIRRQLMRERARMFHISLPSFMLFFYIFAFIWSLTLTHGQETQGERRGYDTTTSLCTKQIRCVVCHWTFCVYCQSNPICTFFVQCSSDFSHKRQTNWERFGSLVSLFSDI